MAAKRPAVQVFSTRIPIDRWLGLTLLAIALVLVIALPAAQLVLFAGVAGGAALATFAILRRRRSDP